MLLLFPNHRPAPTPGAGKVQTAGQAITLCPARSDRWARGLDGSEADRIRFQFKYSEMVANRALADGQVGEVTIAATTGDHLATLYLDGWRKGTRWA